MEDFRIGLFLDVWKDGWANKDQILQQQNRASMQHQLLLLIEGSRTPLPEPVEREG